MLGQCSVSVSLKLVRQPGVPDPLCGYGCDEINVMLPLCYVILWESVDGALKWRRYDKISAASDKILVDACPILLGNEEQ